MPTYDLKLADVRFPAGLPNSKANFRFVVDLRHENADGAFDSKNAVMPSLDTFWECDSSKDDKPNFVRGVRQDGQIAFNMDRVDAWDARILKLKANGL